MCKDILWGRTGVCLRRYHLFHTAKTGSSRGQVGTDEPRAREAVSSQGVGMVVNVILTSSCGRGKKQTNFNRGNNHSAIGPSSQWGAWGCGMSCLHSLPPTHPVCLSPYLSIRAALSRMWFVEGPSPGLQLERVEWNYSLDDCNLFPILSVGSKHVSHWRGERLKGAKRLFI